MTHFSFLSSHDLLLQGSNLENSIPPSKILLGDTLVGDNDDPVGFEAKYLPNFPVELYHYGNFSAHGWTQGEPEDPRRVSDVVLLPNILNIR